MLSQFTSVLTCVTAHRLVQTGLDALTVLKLGWMLMVSYVTAHRLVQIGLDALTVLELSWMFMVS